MKQPAIFIFSFGLIGGVLAASFLPWPVALGFGLLSSWIAQQRLGHPVWLFAGLLVGVTRVYLNPLTPGPTDVVSLAGQGVALQGVVTGYPDIRSSGQRVVVKVIGDRSGKVLVRTPPGEPLTTGDEVALRGKLVQAPVLPDFDYRAYLAKDGIHSLIYEGDVTVTGHRATPARTLAAVRRSFESRLKTLFGEPAGSFLLGILLGERSGLSDSWQTAFQRTGTTHVLALSGYNVSVLIAVMVGLLGRRPAAITASLLLIVVFVLLAGPSASVVRAAAMGSLILVGTSLGRPQEAILACLVTAGGMLMLNPWSLRYDLGFDLSFAATLGILRLEPGFRSMLWWLPPYVKEPVSATLAASLPAMPLIAASFGTVSIIAPVANAVVVPFVPVLMLGAFLAGVASYLSSALASTVAAITQTMTKLLLGAIEQMASLPLASIGASHRLMLSGVLAVAGLLVVRKLNRLHA